LIEDGRERPIFGNGPGRPRQIAEQALVQDTALFVRHLALPVIERELKDVAAGRHVQRGVLGGVVIDYQVQGDGAVPARQAVQSEILAPHAWMKEIGLVARQEKRVPLELGDRLAGGGGQVVPGGANDLPPR
jgi:hypothetical protein